jgi:hypothetical protein
MLTSRNHFHNASASGSPSSIFLKNASFSAEILRLSFTEFLGGILLGLEELVNFSVDVKQVSDGVSLEEILRAKPGLSYT